MKRPNHNNLFDIPRSNMILEDLHVKKNPNQLIIAFTGPSTCGKSTVIKELLKKLNKTTDISVILLDSFFFDHGNIPKTELCGTTIMNYDRKDSVNWERFFRKIKFTHSDVIFIDGFIAFADERTKDIVDIIISFEYNIENDFDIALRRRIHRKKLWENVEPPDDYLENPFIDKLHYTCCYFKNVVWEEMVKHPEYRRPNDWEKPILILPASDSIHENTERALEFIQPMIEAHLTERI